MSPMPEPPPIGEEPLRIEICDTAEELARRGAQLFVGQAARAFGARGLFSVALSGGETPRRAYALLPQDHYAQQVVWPAVHVFWSDERCVPPGDERSNYRMAHETFLSRVGVPAGNVRRMRGEDEPAAEARRYEQELRGLLGEPPQLDLVLLGMGRDGHTASLFAGGPALAETDRLVAVSRDPDSLARLTLSLPAINAARMVLVLVSGQEKAETVRRVLGAEGRAEGLPIQAVRPAEGQMIWVLDARAASLLRRPDAAGGGPGAG